MDHSTESGLPGDDAGWRARLNREQYRVLRRGRTERAWAGAYVHLDEPGRYRCAACVAVLFDSTAKYDAASGWPSFSVPTAGAVDLHRQWRLPRPATEVRCAVCGSHLGHVFTDPASSSGLRYCINSVALTFDPEAERG